jgi:predicted RNA binding protein YcfA (HicA-like mRNA interferase family)
VPRLNCTYAEFIEIIERNGFVLHRHGATSHRRYRCEATGAMVDVTPHLMSAAIPTGTLQSMIRQSGLSKKLFRK